MAPALTQNVVIFGEKGAGKSSVANLMTGQHTAHATPTSESYLVIVCMDLKPVSLDWRSR
ncbi:hypothetical protein BDR06DRAFT_1015647 [Suillus hirtellus]|nr:hypothetical protein BDR06DRAFT_1015647 [Suillus hirtellus]